MKSEAPELKVNDIIYYVAETYNPRIVEQRIMRTTPRLYLTVPVAGQSDSYAAERMSFNRRDLLREKEKSWRSCGRGYATRAEAEQRLEYLRWLPGSARRFSLSEWLKTQAPAEIVKEMYKEYEKREQ